jgi:hypothetical protein
MDDIKILKFKGNTFTYYQTHVKGNEKVTYDQARRKMTRNMMLAYKTDSEGYPGQMYQYGSLWFVVNTKNQIVWIKNYCFLPEGWKVNKIKYLKLNKQLHIEEDVTLLDLVKKDVRYNAKRMFKCGKRKLQVN